MPNKNTPIISSSKLPIDEDFDILKNSALTSPFERKRDSMFKTNADIVRA